MQMVHKRGIMQRGAEMHTYIYSTKVGDILVGSNVSFEDEL